MNLHPTYLLVVLLLAGARVQSQFSLSGRSNRALQELIEFNEVLQSAHVGFALYDVESGGYLYGYNARRHFVPASNVKLLTFYLAHRVLDHRTAAVHFREYPDRYELWGTGYPLTLHPDFAPYDELTPWLASRDRPLVLNFPPGERLPRYGHGWSWDDYNYGSVFERHVLPVYANRLRLDRPQNPLPGPAPTAPVVGLPPSVAATVASDHTQRSRLRRSEYANDFVAGPTLLTNGRFPLDRSLVMTPEFVAREIAAATPRVAVTLGDKPRPPLGELRYLEATVPDTVYRRLLSDSDNFLAEQLLVQAAVSRYGRPDEATLRAYGQDTLLAPLELGDFRWADGSGLSRYSLLTPDQLARLVLALDQEVGRDRLLSLLPAGGRSGTLADRFTDRPAPYLWAKTGSLSGVHCLSGLLRTDRGRWLAFSLLINNQLGDGRAVLGEVEEVMRYLRGAL